MRPKAYARIKKNHKEHINQTELAIFFLMVYFPPRYGQTCPANLFIFCADYQSDTML